MSGKVLAVGISKEIDLASPEPPSPVNGQSGFGWLEEFVGEEDAEAVASLLLLRRWSNERAQDLRWPGVHRRECAVLVGAIDAVIHSYNEKDIFPAAGALKLHLQDLRLLP